jgi:hypothetical protein
MIKISISSLLVFLFITARLPAQQDMHYYFTEDMVFNPDIPTPAEIIGFEVGEKHVRHDQLVKYLYLLAERSDRINIERYGWTYEHRPLLLLTVSSPKNLADIENIRTDHINLTNPEVSGKLKINEMPSVLWLGYSVHGNEPSGVNASLLVAYYLAAAQSSEVNEILDNTVILLDPSINPDGYSRFEQWVNQYKSSVSITDPNNIELNEAWPRGRTNHYWFDLNRDWLPVQHPESQARIRQFYRWRPNILTDHHEMGSDATFFFQPGIPSRINPNTPVGNAQLTAKIAEYHAAALDKIGSLYFSKEVYDDFYYGKGSTYPDVNGSIGILFEQASSRGHARKTDNGILRFPFTIRNQLTVSLSTIMAGYELRHELLEYQVEFYRNASELARKDAGKAYIFDGGNDHTKTRYFLDILLRHQIEVYSLSKAVSFDGYIYQPGNAYAIPLEQKQNKLIKAMFEKTISFTDSLFYDVSAWTFPLAFDLNYALLKGNAFNTGLLDRKLEKVPEDPGTVNPRSSYAYLMRWDDYNAPKALNMLLRNNLIVKVSLKTFSTQEGGTFDPGTILIPVKAQPISGNDLDEILETISGKCHISFFGVSTGFNSDGIDLGSPNLVRIEKPKIMMLVGDGISSNEAGEIWHLLDCRADVPITLIDIDRFNRIDISPYSSLILVQGNYSGITESARDKLSSWLANGGQIIGIHGGAKWLIDQKLAHIKVRTIEKDTLAPKSYGDMERYMGAQEIGGAIFETRLDMTHPLCFGFPDDRLSIFKNQKLIFEPSANPYNNPVLYTDEPLSSGYISSSNYRYIRNSSGLIISSTGRGRTICFSDDPNFRAFWFGTNRLFFNAIFFGSVINSSSAR